MSDSGLPNPSPVLPPQLLSYASPPPRRMPEHVRPWPVLRDIGIIFALTLFGGCVFGMMGVNPKSLPAAIALDAGNLIVTTAGFLLSGCRSPKGNRWSHLLCVALGVWACGLVKAIYEVNWLLPWLLSSMYVAFTMAIGGLLSMLLVKQRNA